MILIDEIGSGSFGNVYAARFEDSRGRFSHELLTETWAVKKIEKDEISFNNLIRELHSFEKKEQDRREARSLRIPYRPLVFYTNEHIWIVMEKFSMSCAEWFTTSLNSNDIRRCARAVLKPLVYLHAKGTGHRDVKPKNMFVNHMSGNIALGDFGSTSLLEGPQYTLNQVCTIDTRAPEYFQEPVHGIISTPTTFRADMWSLGITLLCAILQKPHSPLGEVHPFEDNHEYIRQMLLKKFSASKDELFHNFFSSICGQEPAINLELAVLLSRTLVANQLSRSSASELLQDLDIPVTPAIKRRRYTYNPRSSNFTPETITLRSHSLLDGTLIPLGRHSIPMHLDAPEQFHYANLKALCRSHPKILPTLKNVFEKNFSSKIVTRIATLLNESEENATYVLYLICANIANGFHNYNPDNFVSKLFVAPPEKLTVNLLSLQYEALHCI